MPRTSAKLVMVEAVPITVQWPAVRAMQPSTSLHSSSLILPMRYRSNSFFPSVPELERSRFPTDEALRCELAGAGLPDVRIEQLRQERTITREHALDVIRSQAYSTFELLPEDEYARGLKRAERELAERELPERIQYRFDWLLAVASA